MSGGAYRWFRDHLGREELDRAGEERVDVYELLNELAAQAPAGSEGAIWLPCLMGAMAPEWNADARAVWYGLTPAHTRAHLLRALLEGSAYALRDILGAMRATGLEPREIVCVAGGARSQLWRQIRADVTGLPVAAAADVETTARGAAMLAAAGAGRVPVGGRRRGGDVARRAVRRCSPIRPRPRSTRRRTRATAPSTTRCGRSSPSDARTGRGRRSWGRLAGLWWGWGKGVNGFPNAGAELERRGTRRLRRTCSC